MLHTRRAGPTGLGTCFIRSAFGLTPVNLRKYRKYRGKYGCTKNDEIISKGILISVGFDVSKRHWQMSLLRMLRCVNFLIKIRMGPLCRPTSYGFHDALAIGKSRGKAEAVLPQPVHPQQVSCPVTSADPPFCPTSSDDRRPELRRFAVRKTTGPHRHR